MKTTKDCKQFLGEYFTHHPEFAASVFHKNDEEYNFVMTNANKPANWKRFSKVKPEPDAEYDAFITANTRITNPSYERTDYTISSSELLSVREFVLRPDALENSVAFIVLETKSGELLLGEFVGD